MENTTLKAFEIFRTFGNVPEFGDRQQPVKIDGLLLQGQAKCHSKDKTRADGDAAEPC